MSAINTTEITNSIVNAILNSIPKTYEAINIAGEYCWLEQGTNNVYDGDTNAYLGNYNWKTKTLNY